MTQWQWGGTACRDGTEIVVKAVQRGEWEVMCKGVS